MELIRENIYNSFIYQDRYKYYLTGLGNTIIMAFFACLIGVILGLILSLVIDYNEKTGKLYLLSTFARMYIEIIRGTPALLQLMILYLKLLYLFVQFHLKHFLLELYFLLSLSK